MRILGFLFGSIVWLCMIYDLTLILLKALKTGTAKSVMKTYTYCQ